MKDTFAKGPSTLVLKAVILGIATIALALCVFFFPQIIAGGMRELPEFTGVIVVAFAGIYAAAIPFFIALYQAFTLLLLIDRNTAFSEASVRALTYIQYCAVAMSMCYAAALPLAFVVAELDDAPGLILIAAGFAGSPLVVATFAAVLQRLLRSGLEMKTEHDLTV